MRFVKGLRDLARRSYSIPADKTTLVRTRLTKSAYRTLARKGKLSTTLTVLTRGDDNVLRRAEGKFTLRPRR
jgi:hypothetical protein